MTATHPAKDRLRSLLVRRSLSLGDFTLSSGARSSYYIDARLTTMSAEGQALVGEVCLDVIEAAELELSHVGGLTLGADPITYAVSHESWSRGRPLDGFTVRKRAKEHGTGKRIEGGLPEDARTVVVEDTMTTGGSALEAIDVIRKHGATVEALLVLVDRCEGGREAIEAVDVPVLVVFTADELLTEAKGDG
ncbi:MAG: orotate phosphoribosyltransferase [Longimicrobiales bacterium]